MNNNNREDLVWAICFTTRLNQGGRAESAYNHAEDAVAQLRSEQARRDAAANALRRSTLSSLAGSTQGEKAKKRQDVGPVEPENPVAVRRPTAKGQRTT